MKISSNSPPLSQYQLNREKASELKKYFPGLFYKSNNSSTMGSSSISRESSKKPSFLDAFQKTEEKSSLENLESKGKNEDPKLYSAALDFQAIFIGQMLKAMRKNLNPSSDMLYGGFRQKIFEDMLYDEYSKKLSSSSEFTLARQIHDSFVQNRKPKQNI